MTSLQPENLEQPSDGATVQSKFPSTSQIMESTNLIYETMRSTPRSVDDAKRPHSSKKAKNVPIVCLKSPTQPKLVSSHIPLPSKPELLKLPSFIKNARSSTIRPASSSASRISTSSDNKHTLEIQFINKNKMFMKMKHELEEKHKPLMELHKTLVQLKKRLKELGKFVTLDDLKGGPMKELQKTLGKSEGDGENASNEELQNLKDSLEQIPKIMIDVCKSLLSRRAMIVEVLEKVANSELELSDVSSKIESLKNEGQQLENSLEAVIKDQQGKINELITRWESFVNSRNTNIKSELELQPQEREVLMQESQHVIQNLQQKMENRKVLYDKSIAELNGSIRTLREQIQKLEHDLECERKSTKEIKTRNSASTKTTKALREKISELENYKTITDAAKADLERRNRILHEQVKNKEAQWNREKEELTKALNKHEYDFSKITSEKADYKSTLEDIEAQKITTEKELQNKIDSLENEVKSLRIETKKNAKERDEAREKCAEFETYSARMGLENKETMNKVCESMKFVGANEEAEHVREDMAKDVELRELRDKINQVEREKYFILEEKRKLENIVNSNGIEKEISKQQKCIHKYKYLLEESETKFMQKCNEVTYLQSEMQQLKVRQEALEEQNSKCPSEELQQIINEGRYKLDALVKKTIENEQTLEQYVNVIEKKDQQINNLENLMRYRDNMINVLKGARDEVMFEKISLTNYCTELRQNLTYERKESSMKECLIMELKEKIEMREKQIAKLEGEIDELTENVLIGNDKRFKLQQTIGTMEKELQDAQAQVHRLARSERKQYKPF